MTKRIFRSIFLVALSVFLACLVIILGVLYENFTEQQQQELHTQAKLVARGVELSGMNYFSGGDFSDYRITWVDGDGEVLYDTEVDADTLGNHGDREEIKEALRDGEGESKRYSKTLTRRQYYYALRLEDGTALRVSSMQFTVIAYFAMMLQPFLIVIAVALILSLLFASALSKKIVLPLNRLDLDSPLANEGYDELAPLLSRLESQHRQIQAQMSLLEHKQDEFEAITGSMNEGLVLLNEQGVILGINQSAARLLATDKNCVGRDMLTVNRSLAVQEILKKAQEGQKTETTIELLGKMYQLDASPVVSEGKNAGAVLLMFDITDKFSAEKLRREFTANVSHELKTPLHSILGCAELLYNDMVKPEDMKQFTGQIYFETQRLIRLVDDIIRLSRLDEGGEDMQREKTDLFALASEAVNNVQSAADESSISITLSGEKAELVGIPQLLAGIVYNLCDNAIKYNRPGGSVAVSVENEGNTAVLTVADTGIGIPQEQQARVFERFYRVDKSHSKEIGGTGLGLSIVKHAAALHNASIEMKSTLGKGTEITLRFPK